MGKFIDLTGQKFGKLTVIRRGEDLITTRSYVRWYCDCDCGNKNVLVISRDLKNGHTKSCGCLKSASTINRNKQMTKRNEYDLSGDYGIGWTSNTNEEFYFDLEDYDKIKDYCWSSKEQKKNQHVVYRSLSARSCDSNKIITMHEIITGKKYQDHINHNTFDNRKLNLRDATYSENNKNKKISIKNTSGVTGVNEYEGHWKARICVDYNDICLGIFDKFDDAVKARLTAEKKYFKEFAPQKHLYKQYNIEDNELETN